MRLDYGVIRSPARILFGPGQRRVIGRATAELGRRALVCTDARFADTPVMAEIRADLEAQGVTVEVFDGTEAELPLPGILDCVARFRDFDPEVIVGIGGGSCLDMAKLVSLLLTYEGPISNYYGEFKLPGPVRPIVAVPTTSGTGSEATPVAVLADPEKAMKVGVSDPNLIPHTAICDPELTVTCPKGLTAISGADALAHALECYSAIARPAEVDVALSRVFVGKNGLSDAIAMQAMQAIFTHLRRAVSEPENVEARAGVMMGATLAGMAFGSGGTSAAHAIQYPVGGETKTAHGLGVAVLLPWCMEYNLPAAEKPYAEIARAIGAAPAGADDATAARAAVDAVRALFADIGIPATLAEIGLPDAALDRCAEMAMNSARLVQNNPRPLDVAAIRHILAMAQSGLASFAA